MKKHELLEKAMRDYPAGTQCCWGEGGGVITSTGIFHFNDNYILDSNEMAVYDGLNWTGRLVLKSQDGVDLYAGYQAHHVRKGEVKYRYNGPFTISQDTISGWVFSTKEAAEKWIEEQNGPKEAVIKLYDKYAEAVITKELIWISDPVTRIQIKPSDLEDMLRAYKSLQ